MKNISLEIIDIPFSICQVGSLSDVDIGTPFTFTAVTDSEKSLICPTIHVPAVTLSRSDGWRAIRVCGVLDFSLIGILRGIAEVLAAADISMCAVSTYNTDYIFLRAERLDEAVYKLQDNGYNVIA